MKKSELLQIIKEEIQNINKDSIEDILASSQNRQITLNLKQLSDSEFQEIYDSLSQNPDIYRIRTYGSGFLEVDLIELNDDNKAVILKYKDKIKIK